MFIMRFTERPYVAYTEAEVKNSFRSSVRLTFSNSNFRPEVGARVYDEAFEQNQFSEEAGFDGIMLNEHHNTPTCMGATMNLEAAVLARTTHKAKIVLLGNPLPIFDNPVRLAEELAEIDMMSHGRLVSGFVRGTGVESWATNTNPIHNRERFQEAHDLVIKTWTTPGPFRWEGKHYQFRVVNPFQVPLQKPHPPVWIPGVGSPETLVWAAQHRYPYIYLETDPESTVQMMAIYGHIARQLGYTAGPQNFGYLWRIHVQDTDQKASEVGKRFSYRQRRRRPRADARGFHGAGRIQPAQPAFPGSCRIVQKAAQARSAVWRSGRRGLGVGGGVESGGGRQPEDRHQEDQRGDGTPAAGYSGSLEQRRHDRPQGFDALPATDAAGGPAGGE